ncbi:MAG: phage holin family protein [Bacilli bacterium]
MDLSFLTDFINIGILGICLCVGYVIKNIVNTNDFNKFIPLVVLILGTILSIVINLDNITLEVILTGMFSGLASTGLYEMFKNLINKESE